MSKITTERHYKITLKDGSTYYGRTTQSGNKRYNQHLSQSRLGKHENKHIQESYDKYGYDDWVHEWLGWETGDNDYHNKIEFGYVQADPKALNINDGKRALLDEDEEREYLNKYAQEYRNKNIKTILKNNKKNNKTRLENETPEQREKRRLYDSEKYYRNKEIKRGGDNK
jgi:hypothetical protein